MSSICRVCMGKDVWKQMKVVYLKSQGLTYLSLFNICTRLEAHSHDKLCRICAEELHKFYAFICKAKETDAKLKQEVFETSTTNDALPTEFICTNEYDPLIESDDENIDLELKRSEVFLLPTVPDSDEEDNKPLQEIIQDNKACPKDEVSNNDYNINEVKIYPVEEDYEYDDNSIENMPDFAISAETQIFPKGRFKCRTCGKNYFTTVGLQAHFEVHLPKSTLTKKKRIRGPNKKRKNADKKTVEASHLKMSELPAMDQESQNNVKSEEEEVNDETSNTSVKVVQRKARQQKQPKPKKMFPCHVCGKHMISASKLRYHMVMHTGEKDYLCTMCPKAYSTIYALKHHLRTHTGERPYECKFCGDKFLRPTTLKSHMRRHTGERPYGCDICGKRFIQHSSMTTHLKLNHMAKTIHCPHCDKKYARQTDLNTHLLSHTGNKPFSCQLCPSRFIRQANLNKHMNQQHTGTKLIVSKSTKTKPASRTVAVIMTNGENENSTSLNTNITTPRDKLMQSKKFDTVGDEHLNKLATNTIQTRFVESNQNDLLPSLFTADSNATTSPNFTQFDMVTSSNQLEPRSSKQQSHQLHLYNTATRFIDETRANDELNDWDWHNQQ